jgi:hypothetical protein
MLEHPVQLRMQGTPTRMRRVQFLDQARPVNLGGDHGQRRLVGLFARLRDPVIIPSRYQTTFEILGS